MDNRGSTVVDSYTHKKKGRKSSPFPVQEDDPRGKLGYLRMFIQIYNKSEVLCYRKSLYTTRDILLYNPQWPSGYQVWYLI